MKRNKRDNGAGKLIHLPDGRYRLVWMQGYNSNGKPRRLTVTGKTKSECNALKKQRIDSLSKNEGEDYRKLTLLDLCQRHLEDDLSHADLLKPTSADRREVSIKNQIEPFKIARLQTAAISPVDIMDHVEELISLKYSLSTVEKAYNIINGAFRWAILKEKLTANPCATIHEAVAARFKTLSKKDAYAEDVVVMTDSEQEQLLSMALKKDSTGNYENLVGLVVTILLYTGIRIGEFCALRIADYQIVDGIPCLSITKTRHYQKDRKKEKAAFFVSEGTVKNEHARNIQLDEKTAGLIEELIALWPDDNPQRYLYLNTRGNPTNPSNLGSLINKVYRLADLPEDISGAHVLRRSFATNRYNEGVDIKAIAGYLGDAEATVSQYYIANRKKTTHDGKVIAFVPIPVKKEDNDKK